MVTLPLFVNWKSEYHEDLKIHIENAPHSAKYTSPNVQNKIIQLCETAIHERIMLDGGWGDVYVSYSYKIIPVKE